MEQYATCGHLQQEDWNRWAAAQARVGRTICVPASGHTRDLPQHLDIQDRNLPGRCLSCRGLTPQSSADSKDKVYVAVFRDANDCNFNKDNRSNAFRRF
jgi:hypothetical protein